VYNLLFTYRPGGPMQRNLSLWGLWGISNGTVVVYGIAASKSVKGQSVHNTCSSLFDQPCCPLNTPKGHHRFVCTSFHPRQRFHLVLACTSRGWRSVLSKTVSKIEEFVGVATLLRLLFLPCAPSLSLSLACAPCLSLSLSLSLARSLSLSLG
jgi:hypothetical protein